MQASQKIITSTSNTLVKRLVRLRNEPVKLASVTSASTALLSGYKLVNEICKNITPQLVLTTPNSVQNWKQIIQTPLNGYELADERVIRHVMGVNNINENEAIVAEITVPQPVPPNQLIAKKSKTIITACYHLSDPGNLGTIMRTSYSLGCHGMFIFDQDTVTPYNEKCTRASRGVNFLLPIVCGNWMILAKMLEDYNLACIITSTSDKNSIQLDRISSDTLERRDLKKFDGFVVVLGSEHHGVTDHAIKDINPSRVVNVHIPMAHGFDSLNVSVAGSIILYTLKNLL